MWCAKMPRQTTAPPWPILLACAPAHVAKAKQSAFVLFQPHVFVVFFIPRQIVGDSVSSQDGLVRV